LLRRIDGFSALALEHIGTIERTLTEAGYKHQRIE